jgi:hypothetical protein
MEEPAVDNETPPPEESQNRTFIILAIALGGLFVVGLFCLGGYAFFIRPGQQRAAQTQNAVAIETNKAVIAANTQAALPTNTPTPDANATAQADALTQAAAASPTPLIAATDTDTPVLPTATDTVVAIAQVTDTPSPTLGAAVGGASPTPLGGGGKTGTPTALGGAGGAKTNTPTPLVGGLKTATPTGLPGTGFADQAGAPSLIILGGVLILIVIVARRLRLSLR